MYPVKTPEQMFRRIAKAVAEQENKEDQKKWEGPFQQYPRP